MHATRNGAEQFQLEIRVMDGSDWHHHFLPRPRCQLRLQAIRPKFMAKKRVAIIGSGNWACAIAKIVGANCKRSDQFHDEVRMWVYEEKINGRKLTEIINQDHENVKYMPGIKLPANIIADPDVISTTKDANVLIFVLPHQFLGGLCEKISGNHAADCIAVSLIKAVHFDETGIVLISDMIKSGLKGMDVSVLMGANIATEVASGAFCETTIGYKVEENGVLLASIFSDPLFHVSIVKDVPGSCLLPTFHMLICYKCGYPLADALLPVCMIHAKFRPQLTARCMRRRGGLRRAQKREPPPPRRRRRPLVRRAARPPFPFRVAGGVARRAQTW